MSLINDALRRAKEAQQQTAPPPSPELPFRPVEPAQQSARRGLGLLLPAALAAVALLVLLFAWAWSQKRNAATPAEVNARTAKATQAAAAGSVLKAQTAAVREPASSNALATGAATTLSTDDTAMPVDDTFADIEEGDATNAPAMRAPVPPKPAPLRLQGIVYSPKRPSAMISGKTLFVGEKLGELRVMAIDKESVILVGAGQTNVLSLAE